MASDGEGQTTVADRRGRWAGGGKESTLGLQLCLQDQGTHWKFKSEGMAPPDTRFQRGLWLK